MRATSEACAARVPPSVTTAAAQREEMGTHLTPIARSDHDHAVNAARAALGEDAFAAAWDEGHATPLEEAIADVVGDDE